MLNTYYAFAELRKFIKEEVPLIQLYDELI